MLTVSMRSKVACEAIQGRIGHRIHGLTGPCQKVRQQLSMLTMHSSPRQIAKSRLRCKHNRPDVDIQRGIQVFLAEFFNWTVAMPTLLTRFTHPSPCGMLNGGLPGNALSAAWKASALDRALGPQPPIPRPVHENAHR